DYVGYVPEEMYTVPLGKGVVRRKGSDVTIVAISQMVYEAIKAARILEKEGVDVEIIDPRTLSPLDENLIFESVKKTGRLIIADVACKTAGAGAEIACRVVESAAGELKGPVQRINFADAPTPCSPPLEQAYYPGADNIVAAARKLLRESP
ncbi:MAG: alpha-ketoacid dehydrogenase subunit beta, partial [Phycisphaerae bacterium]|nr:alpha-ketoacid dehydrogenase subunit beta [Phycisphaerae bacterium]